MKSQIAAIRTYAAVHHLNQLPDEMIQAITENGGGLNYRLPQKDGTVRYCYSLGEVLADEIDAQDVMALLTDDYYRQWFESMREHNINRYTLLTSGKQLLWIRNGVNGFDAFLMSVCCTQCKQWMPVMDLRLVHEALICTTCCVPESIETSKGKVLS